MKNLLQNSLLPILLSALLMTPGNVNAFEKSRKIGVGEQPRDPVLSLFSDITFPVFEIELGGESFYMFDPVDRRGLGGLSAIMVDIDGKISDRLKLFAAFHFDSSVWHDFLNVPLDVRRNEGSDYDVELEVEEFFLTYISSFAPLEFSVGRMFSVVSYANQLHLADFQFNMKPRIYSEYWGNNHGLAMDGGSIKWSAGQDAFGASLIGEAAKNRYATDALVITSVVDLTWKNEVIMAGIRGFGYFDHEHTGHPLLYWLPDSEGIGLSEDGKLGLHAYGAGINALWALPADQYIFLQAEWMSRKLSDQQYGGGYAFVLWPLRNRLEGSLMYQQLERPVFTDTNLSVVEEKAYTFGLSYFPLTNHRLRVEYSIFNESHFYNNMLTAKWTFYVNL